MGVWVEWKMGQAPGGARDGDPLGSALSPRARARGQEARRPATRRHARLCLGGVAVLAIRLELEHERRDPARAARLGLPVRNLGALARGLCGASVVDEVRAAPLAAVV